MRLWSIGQVHCFEMFNIIANISTKCLCTAPCPKWRGRLFFAKCSWTVFWIGGSVEKYLKYSQRHILSELEFCPSLMRLENYHEKKLEFSKEILGESKVKQHRKGKHGAGLQVQFFHWFSVESAMITSWKSGSSNETFYFWKDHSNCDAPLCCRCLHFSDCRSLSSADYPVRSGWACGLQWIMLARYLLGWASAQ